MTRKRQFKLWLGGLALGSFFGWLLFATTNSSAVYANPLPKDADKTKPDAQPEVKVTPILAVNAELKRSLESLTKLTRRRNSFGHPAISTTAMSVFAICQSAVESKNRELQTQSKRYKYIGKLANDLSLKTTRRTRDNWLAAKELAAKMNEGLTLKLQEVPTVNLPQDADSVRVGTMKQMEKWLRWMSQNNTLELFEQHQRKAHRDAVLVSLLSASLAKSEPDDDGFAKHAEGLNLAINQTIGAAKSGNHKDYQLAFRSLTQHCTNCHREYR